MEAETCPYFSWLWSRIQWVSIYLSVLNTVILIHSHIFRNTGCTSCYVVIKVFHRDLLYCTSLHFQQWFFQLLLVCPVTHMCRWNTYIFPDKNIRIYTFMNPLEVRVTAKIFNSSWAMKSDSHNPLHYSSHLTTKHTLDVNYPQERANVNWFLSF